MTARFENFAAFTSKHDGVANRLVSPVQLTMAFDPDNPPDPMPSFHDTRALWDTGATNSVITGTTARALGLTPVGKIRINHAGGDSLTNSYVVNFLLPNQVAIPGVLVSECPDQAGIFGAIIGMDIIAAGDFSVTNVGGKTWMSFRIPSISTIDYVAEANKLKFYGIGRNAPCPCGRTDIGGKPIKFKHCHGKTTSI